MSTKLNYEFRQAVQWLYGQGIIRKDGDISQKTGYNKATISGYMTGRTLASQAFLEKFQNVFGLRLEDFGEGGEKETVRHPDALQLISENVLLLKAEHQTNRQLLIEILASVTNRSVTEVELTADKLLRHNVEKMIDELKRG
jgi:transcriptional regulator with XRE-family HTH domain